MTLPPAPPPDALASLLPADVDLATGRGLRHEAAAVVWQAVVWGRLGRGDLAWANLDRVNLPRLRPWIAAERGRILRELGHHASAEALEWPALLAAEDPVDAAMLRVSLVADAVGVGDVGRARRRLVAAGEAVHALDDGPRSARQRVRLGWVNAEVALMGGGDVEAARAELPAWREPDAAAALDPAEKVGDLEQVEGVAAPPLGPAEAASLAVARQAAQEAIAFGADLAHGSDFHRAKSLLFAGVLDEDDRLLRLAEALAPPILRWAVLLARRDIGPAALAAATHERASRAAAEIVAPPGVAFAAPSIAEDARPRGASGNRSIEGLPSAPD